MAEIILPGICVEKPAGGQGERRVSTWEVTAMIQAGGKHGGHVVIGGEDRLIFFSAEKRFNSGLDMKYKKREQILK